jgi:NAD(P)-dependent dehydrogenase (short-subunit alcohol dehydrogenase family)
MTVAKFPDLDGASVFITGGGSGIGAFLTEGFLAQGARVAFVQRSDASAFVAEVSEKHGNTPMFLQCDITDTDALKGCIAQAAEAHGPVRVLVNNAANDERHKTLDVDPDYWDWFTAINLKAYFFACQAVIPGMQAMGGGSIVNFSSISYMMGHPDYPIYTTSNSGINGMSRSLAREFGGDKIRVNALMPGWILTDTQMEKWATEESLADHLKRACLKEHLKPEQIVDPTLFLASQASSAMTGQALVVDGGVVVTG